MGRKLIRRAMARLSNEGRESQEIDRLLGLPPTVKNDEQADEFAGYAKCGRCRGAGYEPTRRRAVDCSLRDWPIACAACKGACYVDLPTGPTTAFPGSPFKQAVMAEAGSMWCPLKLAEDKLQVAVLHQLGSLDCYEANRAAVKHWDLVSLATERKYLMHAAAMDAPWPMLAGIEPAPWPITGVRGMGWVDWADDFQERYHHLVAAIYFTTNPETTTP